MANDASEVGFAYVLGCTMSNNTYSHPSAEFIHQLWQTFLENVNPLTKLVHVPSLQPAIEKAINNIGHIPRGFEALMFAIYSMAILSLTEDECIEIMREARAVLLPRYVAATKAALTAHKFHKAAPVLLFCRHWHSISFLFGTTTNRVLCGASLELRSVLQKAWVCASMVHCWACRPLKLRFADVSGGN